MAFGCIKGERVKSCVVYVVSSVPDVYFVVCVASPVKIERSMCFLSIFPFSSFFCVLFPFRSFCLISMRLSSLLCPIFPVFGLLALTISAFRFALRSPCGVRCHHMNVQLTVHGLSLTPHAPIELHICGITSRMINLAGA